MWTKGTKSWWPWKHKTRTPHPAQILQSLLITFRIKFSSPWSLQSFVVWPLAPSILSCCQCFSSAPAMLASSCCSFNMDACSWPHNLFTCSFLYLEQNFPRYLHELVLYFMQNLAHLSFPNHHLSNTLSTLFPFLFYYFIFIILITIWCPIYILACVFFSFPWQK